MPLPSQKTSNDFPFKHSGQADEYGVSVGDYTTVQNNFDARAIFNQTQINNIIAALLSTASGDSGASQIGYDNGYATIKQALDAIIAAGSGTLPPADSVIDSMLKQTGNNILPNFTAHLADITEHVPYGGATTNTGNAYVLAYTGMASLAVGKAVCFKANADSTGATTLNINSLGAKSIKKANGTDMTNIKNGGMYTVRYDGTNFQLQGSDSSGDVTADKVLAGYTFSNDTDTGLAGTLATTASDYELSTISAVVYSQFNTTPVKKNEFVIEKMPGVYRIKFDLRASDTHTAYGRIYKNGIAHGTLRFTTSMSYVTYTEDLTFAKGDLIQLYMYSSDGANALITNYKICSNLFTQTL